jgi:hypothetical protein
VDITAGGRDGDGAGAGAGAGVVVSPDFVKG